MRFANLTHFLEAKAPNSAPWALAVASSKLLCAPNPCAVSHRMFPERQWLMVCRQQTSRSGITLVDPDNLLRVRRSFPCDALKRICSTKASVNWLWMPDASLEGSAIQILSAPIFSSLGNDSTAKCWMRILCLLIRFIGSRCSQSWATLSRAKEVSQDVLEFRCT